MKKLFCKHALALAGAFFFAASLSAQTQTNVQATVVDPIGIPYANGTYSVQLIPSGTNPTVNGQSIGGAFNGATDATGSFNISLWPNASISTPGTNWQFIICVSPGVQPPLGTGGQCTPPTQVTIAGATQNISSTLNAVAPKLANITIGSVASIAATAPIVATPSPITGTGTLSCPTCIVTNPVTSCTTSGGVAFENGTSNTLTCVPAMVYTSNQFQVTETETTVNAFAINGTAIFNTNGGGARETSGGFFIGQIGGTNTTGTAEGVQGFATDASTGGAGNTIAGELGSTCVATTVKCYGLRIDTPGGTAGSDTEGLQIASQGSANFAIKTGTGKNQFGDNVSAVTYSTATNCTSSASPAVCGSAAAGTVVVAAAATTVVVDTTAVTANSEIFLQYDSSLGTKLSVTCNTTAAIPSVTARTAATSFTITIPAAPVTNPACYSYNIVN